MRSLREAAAQCVMVRLGSNLPPGTPADEDVERVEALVQRCPVGGVLLFNARWPSVTNVLARVQRASEQPLLVASDVERGVGQQVQGATLLPHAMALGKTDDPASAAATLARITAREARTCGIHLAFAPVADVNVEPQNPIIGIRAFGSDVDTVRNCVRAYVRTAHAEGLLATAKHFPGHGRTTADSHATLPVVEATRGALDATDLPPFRDAVDASVDAVMTAHVAFPALEEGDETTSRPATASPAVLGDLLRTEMGFEGAVVSDSLLMEGIQTGDADPGRQAARLLWAGVDVLVDPDDPEAVVDGLVSAVEAGELSADRVREAAQRMHDLKTRIRTAWGEEAFTPSAKSAVDASVGAVAHRQTAARMAQQAVRVDGSAGTEPLLAPSDAGSLAVVIVPATRDPVAAEDLPLVSTLRCTYDAVHPEVVGPEALAGDRADARRRALATDHCLVVVLVEPAAWTDFGLTPEQTEFVTELVEHDLLAVALLGSPDALDDAVDAATSVPRLYTYSTVPDAQKALVTRMAEGA